jgi:hypothetical protein
VPGVVLLAAAVAVNYGRHRRGLSTICSTTRAHLPAPAAAALLVGGFGWLLPHVLRGYPPRATR